jgi:hypothetical protein
MKEIDIRPFGYLLEIEHKKPEAGQKARRITIPSLAKKQHVELKTGKAGYRISIRQASHIAPGGYLSSSVGKLMEKGDYLYALKQAFVNPRDEESIVLLRRCVRGEVSGKSGSAQMYLLTYLRPSHDEVVCGGLKVFRYPLVNAVVINSFSVGDYLDDSLSGFGLGGALERQMCADHQRYAAAFIDTPVDRAYPIFLSLGYMPHRAEGEKYQRDEGNKHCLSLAKIINREVLERRRKKRTSRYFIDSLP